MSLPKPSNESILAHHQEMIETLRKQRDELRQQRYIDDAKIGRLAIITHDLIYHSLIVEAVGKQIAERPRAISSTYEGRVANCPRCEAFITEHPSKFASKIRCYNCAQRLNWNKGE